MIVGEVRPSREPLIQIAIRGATGESIEIEAVVDTGFNDYLTLPLEVVRRLKLSFLESIAYELADAENVLLDVYAASILWDGQWRDTLVAAAEGGPLVGMGLMHGFHVGIDVIDGGRVEIRSLG